MKLITFQHKNVLKEINEKGIYYCMELSHYYKRNFVLYNEIKRMLKTPGIPVFAWARILNKDLEVSLEQVNRADEMTPCQDTDLLLELEVPEYENYLIQPFYDYVGLMFCEFDEFPLSDIDIIKGIQKISSKKIPKNEEAQCELPYIKKEWIVSVHKFEKGNVKETHPMIIDSKGTIGNIEMDYTRITKLIKVS